jgi:hypothetical protein
MDKDSSPEYLHNHLGASPTWPQEYTFLGQDRKVHLEVLVSYPHLKNHQIRKNPTENWESHCQYCQHCASIWYDGTRQYGDRQPTVQHTGGRRRCHMKWPVVRNTKATVVEGEGEGGGEGKGGGGDQRRSPPLQL